MTQLDATAEFLVEEVLLAAGFEPERFDTYANQIGKTKSIRSRVCRNAQNLHALREEAMGPHARDRTRELRQGLSKADAETARESFLQLFEEVLRFLRKCNEESGGSTVTKRKAKASA